MMKKTMKSKPKPKKAVNRQTHGGIFPKQRGKLITYQIKQP